MDNTQTTIDITAEPVNITPMTAQEARECTEEIKGNLESLRRRLLEMDRREGYKALGYAGWREWALSEFPSQSQSYLYRLLAAARVEDNLTQSEDSTIVESAKSLPVTQSTELAKLPPNKQPEGLRKADELAASEGKRRTAAHVSKAVKTIKGELNQRQKSIGLGSWNGKQVLPDAERNEAPTNEAPTTREFTIPLANSTVRVVFTPEQIDGMPHQFEFHGMLTSETGYKCEFIGKKRLSEYLNEQACAIALATQFYEELLKKGNGKTSDQRDGIVAIDGDRSKLPPWLQTYLNLKDANPEAIALVKVGDFYETYRDDARTFASATEVLSTSKSAGVVGRVPMAGIPVHAIAKYLDILQAKGFKTVIDDLLQPTGNHTPDGASVKEMHIPLSLSDCVSLDEAGAYVEQASVQQLWQEARCLSSALKRLEADPLQQAIIGSDRISRSRSQGCADRQRDYGWDLRGFVVSSYFSI